MDALVIERKRVNLMDAVQIIGLVGLPIIKPGDNLAKLICAAVKKQGIRVQSGDIFVVTHVVVSRAEGNIINLDDIVPSKFAENVALHYDKDPALVEVVLRESKSIRRMNKGKLITETKHGFICANSGVDRSNVPGERIVAPLPKDPDFSSKRIRNEIKRLTGCDVAVIVSDTHGRPFREGEINVAIGVSGIKPLRDRRGEKDLFDYILHVKRTAVADELASSAELVIGQADEAIPVALIRGYPYQKSEEAKATELVRPKEKDLFL